MSGPTIHKTLSDRVTDPARSRLLDQLEMRASVWVKEVADEVERMLRHAYAQGVSDGYVQGVADSDSS